MEISNRQQVIFFLLINTRSGPLVGIQLFICISEFRMIWCVPFFKDGFCFVRILLSSGAKFQSFAPFPVDYLSHLVMSSLILLYLFVVLLTMWLTIASLSPHNVHVQFCLIKFHINLIGPYGVFFCCNLKRLSLSRFSFLSYDQLFICAISPVCCLKYLYSCFSSHFCFLVFVIFLSILMLALLQLAAVIYFFALLNIVLESLYWYIYAIFNASDCLPSPFLDTYTLYMPAHGCKALCMAVNFLVLCFFHLSSSLVHFKNSPEYLYKGYCPGVYPFDEIFAAGLGFEKHFCSLEILFSYFFPHLRLFDVVHFQ